MKNAAAVPPPCLVSIDEFAQILAAVPENEFTAGRILESVQSNRVSIDSLAPYLYFSSDRYTRNLIQTTPLYELLALCWEPGQRSTIHNHRGQRCWMGVAHGRVQVQNFRVIARDDQSGYCELAPSDHYIIDAASPAEVDPEEPVHMVTNASSFGSRAVTLHIYSRPFDTCEVYDLKEKSCRAVRLTNTSEYGVLKPEMDAARIRLG